MKSRPRATERRVAEILSDAFTGNGYKPVKRIPVLGRTGPDISLNELKFVIDVKSRIEVPRFVYLPGGPALVSFPDMSLVGFKLECMLEFLNGAMREYDWLASRPGVSVIVKNWYDHMNEWTKENEPEGITMLVLHHSGINGGRMPVGHSTVVISITDYQKFFSPGGTHE
jgi:hypothetical protein